MNGEREKLRTENGTALRTVQGWAWLCDSCGHAYQLGVADDHPVDLQDLMEQLDRMHWCTKKGTGA